MSIVAVTPLIQQYLEIKEKYLEEIVFYQVGDFYELFFSDAQIAAKILSIMLTKRGQCEGKDIPLCGIPVHMAEQYYQKLIKAGYTVVICQQVEVAQVGKLVHRAVVDIITPSTICTEETTDLTYSLFITFSENHFFVFWFAFLEQEIFYATYENNEAGIVFLRAALEKYKPKEVIVNKIEFSFFYDFFKKEYKIKGLALFQSRDEIVFFSKKHKIARTYDTVINLFLSYMRSYFEKIIEKNQLVFKKDSIDCYLFLDKSTQIYLECVENLENGGKENTLFGFLDQTKTKMASRLLKKWILYPLKNKSLIEKRQKMIQFFLEYKDIAFAIQGFLEQFGDIERLFQRIRLRKMKERDYARLVQFSQTYQQFILYLKEINCSTFFDLVFFIPDRLFELIHHYINTDTTIFIDGEIPVINPHVNPQLEYYYEIIVNQNQLIQSFLDEEKKRTGIADLVIKKTPIYEYVFELSKVKEKQYEIPLYFIRVQTLAQKERYTSVDLQKLSADIATGLQEYKNQETKTKEEFLLAFSLYQSDLLFFADSCAMFDVYIALAEIASRNYWTAPMIKEAKTSLRITLGKHPLFSTKKDFFVANSLYLYQEKKTSIITGPNMGGKSTYMRQNALLIILAHIGSFIPAESAEIPLMNAIFTRIGASDSVSAGKSTFFVELEEIAHILSCANEESFVIIDEIGRGTSTYDGIALAASIMKYLLLYKNPYLLCSTHYHELATLLEKESILWQYMTYAFKNNTITFLYTLLEGIADNSMGIALAKKVGLPQEIIENAQNFFIALTEKKEIFIDKEKTKELGNNVDTENSITLFLKALVQERSIDDISPRESFMILEKIYNKIIKK